MEIRPVGAALIYADRPTDGRIDMMMVIGTFRDYVNAPKNPFVLDSSWNLNHSITEWLTCYAVN
jgi:hypothetical protein